MCQAGGKAKKLQVHNNCPLQYSSLILCTKFISIKKINVLCTYCLYINSYSTNPITFLEFFKFFVTPSIFCAYFKVLMHLIPNISVISCFLLEEPMARWKFVSAMNLQFINIIGDAFTNLADFFPICWRFSEKSTVPTYGPIINYKYVNPSWDSRIILVWNRS